MTLERREEARGDEYVMRSWPSTNTNNDPLFIANYPLTNTTSSTYLNLCNSKKATCACVGENITSREASIMRLLLLLKRYDTSNIKLVFFFSFFFFFLQYECRRSWLVWFPFFVLVLCTNLLPNIMSWTWILDASYHCSMMQLLIDWLIDMLLNVGSFACFLFRR